MRPRIAPTRSSPASRTRWPSTAPTRCPRPSGSRRFTGWRTPTCRRSRRWAGWGCCSVPSAWQRYCCATRWRGCGQPGDRAGCRRARRQVAADVGGIAAAVRGVRGGGVVIGRRGTRGHARAAAGIVAIGVTSMNGYMGRVVVATGVAVTMLVSPLGAENWPQWRGPTLNGISGEKNLPVKWSVTENVAWKVAVPQYSGSTPIVWGEHIFLNVADQGSLHLWALDRATGATRWKRLLSGGDRRQMKQNMSSPSPVTDGRHVWAMTGTGMLLAFDFDGKELWKRDIQRDYGRFGIMHGYASSPLLHEGALYVPVLHGMMTNDPSYVLKIDKLTGKTIWRVERPTTAQFESPDAYTTPALLRHAGGTEIVITG